MRNSTTELVRVRVRFLEPGDMIFESELDTGLNSASMEKDARVTAEDLHEQGYYKLDQDALADALSSTHINMGPLYSPNDPQVEMLRLIVLLEFDPLGMTSDWEDAGAIGWDIAQTGVYDVFAEWFSELIEHAACLRKRNAGKRTENGYKLFFYAHFRYWTSQDYDGEYNSGVEFEGIVDIGELKATPPLRLANVQAVHPVEFDPDQLDLITF